MQINSFNTFNNKNVETGTKNKNVAFKGTTPDLNTLREKQDEFKRMSEQAGEKNGLMGKLGSIISKGIGVVIAFTATKICLDKAANFLGNSVGGWVNTAVDKITGSINNKMAGKTAEEAAKLAEKVTSLTSKVSKTKDIMSKVQKYAVNIIAGGAAVGVAMKDFGLVNKQMSTNAEVLVDKAIDKANETDYNSSGSAYDEFGTDEKDNEF